MPSVLTQTPMFNQSQHDASPDKITSQGMGADFMTSSVSVTSADSFGVPGIATLGVSPENSSLFPSWQTEASQKLLPAPEKHIWMKH